MDRATILNGTLPYYLHVHMQTFTPLCLFSLLLLMASYTAMAHSKSYSTDELFDLPLSELLKLKVTTSSKTSETWENAPSSLTVITAADIAKSSAQTLFDLLQNVPGISVDYDARDIAQVNVRGIKGSPILYLLNGQSLSGVISGSATNIAMLALPINNIKRIEIIRGPGSALYGANALIGIVNIMTFDGRQDKGTLIRVDASFNEDNTLMKHYTLNQQKKIKEHQSYDINLSILDYDESINIKRDIEDNSGLLEKRQKHLDLQLNAAFHDLEFFTRLNQYERDDFLGLTNYINDDGEESADSFYGNIKWNVFDTPVNKLTVSAFYDYKDIDWLWHFFPAGSAVTAPGESFSDWNASGVISNLLWKEEKLALDALNIYHGIPNHTLVLGITSEYQRAFDIQHISNQRPNFLSELEDVSENYNWNDENDRLLSAVYMQDTWHIQKGLTGNIGARYDYYNDFGSSFNPRLALHWQVAQHHSLKLLYGQAFRAPDFGDLYAKNLFGSNGNPDLNPETITTSEIIINSRWHDRFITTFTLFSSQMEDLIISGSMARNEGNISSEGVEAQIRYDISQGSYISLNHTYAYSQTNHHYDASLPKNKTNILLSYAVNDSLNVQFNGYRQDEVETSVATFSSYQVSNMALLKRNIYNQFDLKLSLLNIFDETYNYPSNNLPQGYPGARRSIQVQLNYSL